MPLMTFWSSTRATDHDKGGQKISEKLEDFLAQKVQYSGTIKRHIPKLKGGNSFTGYASGQRVIVKINPVRNRTKDAALAGGGFGAGGGAQNLYHHVRYISRSGAGEEGARAPAGQGAEITGHVIDKGAADELTDKKYLRVSDLSETIHYVPIGENEAYDKLEPGSLICVRPGASSSGKADYNINRIARQNGGISCHKNFKPNNISSPSLV